VKVDKGVFGYIFIADKGIPLGWANDCFDTTRKPEKSLVAR
jgi:hypothetical protein